MICIGASISASAAAAAAAVRIPRHRLVHEVDPKPGHRRSRSLPPASRTPTAVEMETTKTFRRAAAPASSSSSSSRILPCCASGRLGALLSLVALRNVLLLLSWLLFLLLLPFRWRPVLGSSSSSSSSAKSGEKSKREVVVRLPAVMVAPPPRCRDAEERRTLAIKRVQEEEEEDKDGRSSRGFAMFRTARGDTLFTRSWLPVSVKTRGLLVLMHGLNEHSGRYSQFAKQLNDRGFKVYAMDWIGHGGSDGLHGYVHSLDFAVADLMSFLENVLLENPGLPCFIFGHSTGAAIILKAVLDPKIKTCIKGVVLTSPAIGVQTSHPIISVIAPIFSFLVPTYQFNASYRSGPPVSRDPEALRSKYSDPLVFTGSIRIRTGYEILKISTYLQQNLSRVTVPFLVLHGTADTMTDPVASRRFYLEASSSDKSIKLYEGFLHDLLFEPERDEIAEVIINWLSYRIDGPK